MSSSLATVLKAQLQSTTPFSTDGCSPSVNSSAVLRCRYVPIPACPRPFPRPRPRPTACVHVKVSASSSTTASPGPPGSAHDHSSPRVAMSMATSRNAPKADTYKATHAWQQQHVAHLGVSGVSHQTGVGQRVLPSGRLGAKPRAQQRCQGSLGKQRAMRLFALHSPLDFSPGLAPSPAPRQRRPTPG